MKQARFEQQYRSLWDSLEQQLDQLEALRVSRKKRLPLDSFVADYRQLCHQLALARERTYSLELQQYLNNLVLRAHRQLYRYNPPLADRIGEFFASGFPGAVRRQWKWHLISALSFILSITLAWALVQQQPEMVYTVVDEAMLSELELMYQPEESASADIHAGREGEDDVLMFGYYIKNNIGIAFRTFAGGLLLGVGAIFVMLFNGSFFGAIAGHLINTGSHEAFFTFVIAHGAPELTAIVLAGGAGLRLGWSIIAPGQWSRLDALRLAARDALPTMYGVFTLLLLAAFIEAFWSPRDFAPTIKYSVGAACWALLYLYLFFGGRQRGAGKG
ncbi:MAG: stage II sporulation protein M [Alcanivorax sp.]|uniref:stage II sporulation protein M n=1 Tax=Alcanivorax sp. TaxID=1872427 RepID=UPI003DA73FCD